MKLEQHTQAGYTVEDDIERGLDLLEQLIAENNEAKGWNDDDRILSAIAYAATQSGLGPGDAMERMTRWLQMSRLAMIAGEVAEAQEEVRNRKPGLYFKSTKTGQELTHITTTMVAEFKPEGDLVEVADSVIRAADYFRKHGNGIKLSTVLLLKHRYNETREHRHGGKML